MALAAEGQNLALVWHKGVCQGRDQNLGVAVWDMAEQSQAWGGSLVLSPGATLTWLGFSEAGMLATYDSQVGPELEGLCCRPAMCGTRQVTRMTSLSHTHTHTHTPADQSGQFTCFTGHWLPMR